MTGTPILWLGVLVAFIFVVVIFGMIAVAVARSKLGWFPRRRTAKPQTLGSVRIHPDDD